MGALPFRFELPAGLATLVGALPQMAHVEAARMLLDRLPRLPGAALTVELSEESVDDPTAADPTSAMYAPIVAVLTEMRGRVEPISLAVTGPVTIALALRFEGVPAPEADRRATAAVQVRARQLLALAADLLPGAPVLLFLDEPGLSNSMHPTFPMTPAEIEGLLSEVVDGLASEAMIGVQVSGRADWGLLLRTGIAVLGAPVTARLETAAAEISAFLEGGGIMAWGAVPVDEPFGMSAERLWRRLSAVWCELVQLGTDPLLLRERAIIIPSGGLGNFGFTQAERILTLTQELAGRVLNQTIGVKLSIGA